MVFSGCLMFKSGRNRTRISGSSEEKKRMTREQVDELTMNFSMYRVIAFGGFSTVYSGKFPDFTMVAIKVVDCTSNRLRLIYNQELEILRKIQHENIVKLLGYCDDEEEGVLVLEYAPKGTLQENLHGKSGPGNGEKSGPGILPWKNRAKIAFQLARALEYLHDQCDPLIVHGDIKSSNILLDSDLNCKLCDFGSAKMGFSPSIRSKTTILGSPGYTDPHYLRTGIATKKSDVYSFGIVLLELITGLEPVSADNSSRLMTMVGPMLSKPSEFARFVDQTLVFGDFELGEIKAMAEIAAMCVGDSPSLRPSASDILRIMMDKVGSVRFLCSVDHKKVESPTSDAPTPRARQTLRGLISV